MGNRWFISIVIVQAAILALVVGLPRIQKRFHRELDPTAAAAKKRAEMFLATRDYPPVAMDIAGDNRPHFVSAADSMIGDEDIVIGVVAFGESRAYLRSAFDGAPSRHIVNDKFGSVPVSITHCDRTRCTRVLTRDTMQSSLNIRCGGWLAVQEMALLVDSQSYPQSSPEIPLEDLPFVVTTWKEWLAAQPGTLVYVGKRQEG